MRTSDRLRSIAEKIRDAQRELKRLAVDLPAGQTLEVVDSAEARVRVTATLLETEAGQLSTRFGD